MTQSIAITEPSVHRTFPTLTPVQVDRVERYGHAMYADTLAAAPAEIIGGLLVALGLLGPSGFSISGVPE